MKRTNIMQESTCFVWAYYDKWTRTSLFVICQHPCRTILLLLVHLGYRFEICWSICWLETLPSKAWWHLKASPTKLEQCTQNVWPHKYVLPSMKVCILSRKFLKLDGYNRDFIHRRAQPIQAHPANHLYPRSEATACNLQDEPTYLTGIQIPLDPELSCIIYRKRCEYLWSCKAAKYSVVIPRVQVL